MNHEHVVSLPRSPAYDFDRNSDIRKGPRERGDDDEGSLSQQPFLSQCSVSISGSSCSGIDERGAGSEHLTQNESNGSHLRKGHADTTGLFSRFRRAMRDGWMSELTCLMIALLATAVLIGILAMFDNKPLQSFGKSATLNTVISILISVSEFAIIYAIAEALCQQQWLELHSSRSGVVPATKLQTLDSGGRSALNALQLLQSTSSFRTPAILGALVMILHLAIGPFAQQTVNYPNKPYVLRTAGQHGATISRAQSCAGGGTQALGSQLELAIKMAVMEPLTNTSSVPRFSCSTGNCTWEDFTTLAVCADCVTLSQYLQYDRCDAGFTYENGTQIPPRCNVTFPSGSTMMQNDGSFSAIIGNASILYDGSQILENGYSDTPYSNATATLEATRLSGLSFASVDIFHKHVKRESYGKEVKDLHDEDFERIGFQCKFSACLQTHSDVRSQNGDLMPQNVTRQEIEPLLVDIQQNVTTNDASNTTHLLGRDEFRIIQNGFGLLFNTFFDGGRPTWTAGETYRGSNSQINQSTLVEQARLIAEGMTNAMRDTCHTGEDNEAYGDTFLTTAFIEVRWAWMILPILVLLLASISLVWTIYQSKAEQCPNWKSSSLALLYHGLITTPSEALDNLSDMDKFASKHSLHIMRGEHGRRQLAQERLPENEMHTRSL